MKKIYIHKIHLILCFTSVLCFGLPINAQQNAKNGAADNNKKAWEIGIGATGLQMTRFNVINFHTNNYNPQIQISAESETKRSIFREKDKTKRSKKESAQHSKSRNKSFVMTSVSAL